MSGYVQDEYGSGLPPSARLSMSVFYLGFGRTAEAGSRTLVGATGLGPESNGKLWTNDKLEEYVLFLLLLLNSPRCCVYFLPTHLIFH